MAENKPKKTVRDSDLTGLTWQWYVTEVERVSQKKKMQMRHFWQLTGKKKSKPSFGCIESPGHSRAACRGDFHHNQTRLSAAARGRQRRGHQSWDSLFM
eukprot:g47562.t1